MTSARLNDTSAAAANLGFDYTRMDTPGNKKPAAAASNPVITAPVTVSPPKSILKKSASHPDNSRFTSLDELLREEPKKVGCCSCFNFFKKKSTAAPDSSSSYTAPAFRAGK